MFAKVEEIYLKLLWTLKMMQSDTAGYRLLFLSTQSHIKV